MLAIIHLYITTCITMCYYHWFAGAALNIDPRQFYTQLYGAILQLDACKSHTCMYIGGVPTCTCMCSFQVVQGNSQRLWRVRLKFIV